MKKKSKPSILSRLFNSNPTIIKVNDSLHIYSLYRTVEIHPSLGIVEIKSDVFGIHRRSRKIPYKDITSITYGYGGRDSDDWLSSSENPDDIYTIGIRLRNDDWLSVAKFKNNTQLNHPSKYPDWIVWREFDFDARNKEFRISKAFVDLLLKLIPVTLSPR